jgi:hypothetical protein
LSSLRIIVELIRWWPSRTSGTSSAQLAQQLDVAPPLVAEGEPLAEVDLARLEPHLDEAADELLCRERGQLAGELEDDDLPHAQVLEPLHFLVKSLEQRRGRLRLEHLARVRVEGDQRRRRAAEQGALDHRAHDLLVAEVEAVEDPEREHRRAAEGGVNDAVKNVHSRGRRSAGGALSRLAVSAGGAGPVAGR